MDGLQRGYVGITIAAGDSGWYGGDGNGDPRNDPPITGTFFRFLDVMEARTAFLGPANAWAFALNAWMLQGWVNIPVIDESVAGLGGGWNSILNVGVPFHYNCDADLTDSWVGTDDGNGPSIDTWELYLTEWGDPAVVPAWGWSLIADDTNFDFAGDTYFTAFGSTSIGPSNGSTFLPRWGGYWSRYNEDPAVGSNSVLVTVHPANAGAGHVPACNLDSNVITGINCDDNEFCVDFTIIPSEVNAQPFGAGGIPIPGTAGDVRIQTSAPMGCFVFTQAGVFADVYPCITEGKYVNIADAFWTQLGVPGYGTGHVVDPEVTEVIEISFQESHP